MTIPGNVLPKIFSAPWDKAPPATPTTPSVEEFIVSTPSIVFLAVAQLCTLSPYGNPAKLQYHFAAERDVASMRDFHIPVDPLSLIHI